MGHAGKKRCTTIHAYADDLQMYMYANCAASDQQTAIDRLLTCIGEIDQWMSFGLS